MKNHILSWTKNVIIIWFFIWWRHRVINTIQITRTAIFKSQSCQFLLIKTTFSLNTKFNRDSCTHTGDDEPVEWWKVTLDKTYAVHSVNVFGRTDGSMDRLDGAVVSWLYYTWAGRWNFIYNYADPLRTPEVFSPVVRGLTGTPQVTVNGATIGVIHYVTGHTNWTFPAHGLKGGEVKVTLPDSEHLTLCEVEVMGTFLLWCSFYFHLFLWLPQ